MKRPLLSRVLGRLRERKDPSAPALPAPRFGADEDRVGHPIFVIGCQRSGTPLLRRILDRDGAVLASVQNEAERIWPPKAGYSCRAITTPVDAVLERRLTSMLASLGWVGLAQFRMLVPPGGPPHVIDFNGRFYASLESAIAAGVNFPVIRAELAPGHHGPRQRIEGNRVSDSMAGTGKPGAEDDDRRRALQLRVLPGELEGWAPKIEELAASARQTHVVMNNCYRDYAVNNARQLADLLGGRLSGVQLQLGEMVHVWKHTVLQR